MTTSFSKLDIIIADIKIWENDLRGLDDGLLKNQLLHNVAPFLRGTMVAVGVELAEQAQILADQSAALEELIEQEGGFLQPDMANDLKAVFMVGMAIVGIIESEGITLPNELKNKQLRDAMKLYKTNTTILLDQIDAITNIDEGEDDDNNTDDELHGQGEEPGDDDTGDDDTGDDDDGDGDDGDGDGATPITASAEESKA